ncbi:succinate dehydrogenase, hydrophobic membrane anchor protein [Sandarakinorhabdus rubra]|uniref:succinate dehydrogenase, hydrophobic membrane anchor protein n=1 Tax=Sandarakinorhabdus rubra TaxID=2672568 RepID=UPI0013DC9933|nr:succinate dehydrogenase, hydrophobic membrane anchor protein [Sandarakinorhabdus rubra]
MGNGTQLGRVRGLGAGGGAIVHHWWLQRVTAVGSLILVLWFVISLVRLPSLDYASAVMWVRQPIVAVPLCLLIVSVFWHFRLGVQVMLEDYLHGSKRVIAMLALNFYTVSLAAMALFSVLKVALSAAAN